MRTYDREGNGMDMFGLFENLIDRPAYVLDVLPVRVPEGSRGEYWEVEDFWLRGGEFGRLAEKFLRVLLKLYCYYDIDVTCFRYGAGEDPDEAWKRNPAPAELERIVNTCLAGERKGYVNVVLNGNAALLVMDSDSLYLSVYGPDEALRELLARIAASEGLFFRKAPDGEGE